MDKLPLTKVSMHPWTTSIHSQQQVLFGAYPIGHPLKKVNFEHQHTQDGHCANVLCITTWYC